MGFYGPCLALVCISQLGSTAYGEATTLRDEILLKVEVDQNRANHRHMERIIDKHFRGLSGGSFLRSNLQRFASFDVCPKIIKGGKLVNDTIYGMLGYKKYCGANVENQDATCKAIRAVEASFEELARKFPEGPAYAKSFMVNWGSEDPQKIESCTPDSYSNVNLTAAPPSATLIDGNGCNAYAMCDLLITVLSQSNDQARTGTCGPSSTLAALALRDPVRAMKYGVSLIWTGKHKLEGSSEVCPAIYEQQPGLIPIPKSAADCEGAINENDCLNSIGMPMQIPFENAWVASLLMQYNTRLNTGMCKESLYPFDLITDNTTPEEVGWIQGLQLSYVPTILFFCEYLLPEYTFEIIENNNRAPFNELNWTVAEIDKFVEFPMSNLDIMSLYPLTSPLLPKHNISENDLGTDFTRMIQSVTEQGKLLNVPITQFVQELSTPSFTEDLLEEACKLGGALLMIRSDLLDGPATTTAGQCNHWVFLENCDANNDQYFIWSWNQQFVLTKEHILGQPIGRGLSTGMICGAITIRS